MTSTTQRSFPADMRFVLERDEHLHLLNLWQQHRRRQRVLERQCAAKGLEAPPSLITEIEDINVTIRDIEERIGALGTGKNNNDQAATVLLDGGTGNQIRLFPPKHAQYLLWYLPRAVRNDVMGDLEEEFSIVYRHFGRRKAVVWYYCQVIASFWPFVVAAIRKLTKWGIFAWAGEAVRRFIS